jgi:Spore Coat Protein U domain.
MKSNTFKLALLAILSAAAAGAQAAPTFLVSASVAQTCSATASPLAFGAYDPVGTNNATGSDLLGTTTVVVQCTKGSAGSDAASGTKVAISLNNGLNGGGTARALKNTGNTDVLSYELYLPSLGGTGEYDSCPATPNAVWGTTALTGLSPLTAFWTGAAHPLSVCGVVAKGQPATGLSVGTYQDTITVTLTF